MKRLRNHHIGIDHGEMVMFSDFDSEGLMWAGEGQREVRKEVSFSEPFRSAPIVTVSLSMWDINSNENARGDLSAVDVTPDGFSLVFKTWGDTKVARLRAAWQAIGEVGHADDWELY